MHLMTDLESGTDIADLSIDDQVSALGIEDSTMVESVTADDDDPSSSMSSSVDVDHDEDYEEADTNAGRAHQRSRRKRQCADFPWSQTHDWIIGDPARERGERKCTLCQKWFSARSNAQGWKNHLSTQHKVTATSLQSPNSRTSATGQQQQQTLLNKSMPIAPALVQRYENAVVDFVIGGDISLRVAGEALFYKLVETLTNSCYKPPSTRTILRRTVELFNIAQPLLGSFYAVSTVLFL